MKNTLLLTGILGLISISAMAQNTPSSLSLVKTGKTGTIWKYFVSSNANPPANWKTDFSPQFNDTDAPWYAGSAPLGYGIQGPTTNGNKYVTDQGGTCIDACVSNPATPPSCYTNCSPKSITTYFRTAISVSAVAGSTFSLQYQRDDGIVIYINGQEVIRENLPGVTGAPVSYSATASPIPTDADELVWITVPPDKFASKLKDGQNLIAAEIHQNSVTGSDIRFNMELQQTPPVLERGPYLQRYSDNPDLVVAPDKRSMTIRWSTNVAAQGQVIYRKKTDAGTPPGSTTTTSLQSSTPYSWTAGTGTIITLYDMSVTLINLEPDTPYSYTIQSGTLWQGDATNYFKTAPLLGSTKKIRIWALGDFGKKPDNPQLEIPNADQIKVRDSFTKYVQDKIVDTDKYVDLWLWLGDNAYDWGRNWEYQRSVFDVYDGRKNVSAMNPQWIMKQTPIFATPGNHEYREAQNFDNSLWRKDHSLNHYYDVVNNMTTGENAGKHSGKEEYYSFDHANIHFVSLDSYGYQKTDAGVMETTIFPTGGVQLEWLKSDLAKAQTDSRIKWIVVIFHHPPYTITNDGTLGSHNSDQEQELKDIRARLLPVLEQYKVDLVLNGHSHTYQRSWPIQGHYGLEKEFIDNMNTIDTYRVPVAANASSYGRYDCLNSLIVPFTFPSSKNTSLIYNKSSTAPKNYTVYVVNGSGGGGEGTPGPKWPHDAMQGYFYGGGSMYLEIEGNRLDGKFIDSDGVIRDQFKIIKDADTFTIPLTDDKTHKPDCECNDKEGYTHYVERMPAGNANLLLSIYKNGNSIGTVGDASFDMSLQGKPASTMLWDYTQPNDYVKASINVMNRYWRLKPTQSISAPNTMSVRQYWRKGVDLNTFFNTYGGPYQVMYDYSYQQVTINDDGSLPPAGYERNPVNALAGQPSPHYSIPKAVSYTGKGAWVYKYGSVASSTTFKFGVLAKDALLPSYMQAFSAEYSEFMVSMAGPYKCIGGMMSGAFNPYIYDGNARIATLQTQDVKVILFPNPVQNGKVHFDPVLTYKSYKLTNLEGKVLRQINQAGSLNELDLSALPAGAYILESQGEDGISQFKIIKNE